MPHVPPRLAALLALLLAAGPAPAVIMKLTPLKEVIASEEFIFVASVDKVDADKPAVVFTTAAADALKGKTPFERLPVNLTGDAEAKKEGHAKVLLDRLDAGRKLVVFASKRGKKFNAMAFTEGTWFSLQGTTDDDGKTVRWALLHAEPFLRRTFVGTTAELKTVVEDALANKAEPPKPNEKEPQGYGPPVEKKGSAVPRAGGPALFGVIPSVVLVGPLAIVAALFPGLFARLAVGMKRWRAFLTVASINSTLAVVYYFVRDYLPDVKAVGGPAFTAYLLAVTAVGLLWAGRRYRRMSAADPVVTAPPTSRELGTLAGATAATGLLAAGFAWYAGSRAAAFELPMREFTFIAVGLAAATLYSGYRALTRHADRKPDGTPADTRVSLSGEAVGLGALFLCGLVTIALSWNGNAVGGPVATGTTGGDADSPVGPRLADVKVFEVPDSSQVMSGLTVTADRIVFGAMRVKAKAEGQVFALDRTTGKVAWTFEADDDLLPVFCTPTVADGKVFTGEGLHEDKNCRFFALDAATGKPAWKTPITTTSHTEGNPRVRAGKVYFTAGDDGLICAEAATGARVWAFDGKPQGLHIDGPPAVAGNRVFAGSGLYTRAIFALDADTGKQLWRTPVALRSFGPPLALGDKVVYGLGTGNLGSDVWRYDEEAGQPPDAEPAGAVVCVDAASGVVAWKYDLTRSVHTSLAADAFSVYATARDGFVHCLDRRTGKLRWKTGIGGAVTGGPAVATAGGFPVAVYAASREGTVVCLNPHTGAPAWERPLPGFHWDGTEANGVMATPVVVTVATPAGSKRTVYVGAMVNSANTGKKTAAVFAFEDEIGE